MVKPLPIVRWALGSIFSTVNKEPRLKHHTECWLSLFPSRKGRSSRQSETIEERRGQVWASKLVIRRTVPNLEQPWAVQQPQASQGYTRPCLLQWQQKREDIKWYLRSREWQRFLLKNSQQGRGSLSSMVWLVSVTTWIKHLYWNISLEDKFSFLFTVVISNTAQGFVYNSTRYYNVETAN